MLKAKALPICLIMKCDNERELQAVLPMALVLFKNKKIISIY